MLALLVCVAAVAFAQRGADPTLADKASMISRLAYAGTEWKGFSPLQAQRRALHEQQERSKMAMTSPKYNRADQRRAARLHTYGKSIRLVQASRDVIAYLHKHSDGKDRLIFGFRGTASWKDILPDIQLALNKRTIARLNRSREWTRFVRLRFRSIPNSHLFFTGHSLGGWVAEGVGNDYPGSNTATIEPGAPVFSFGSKYARAFNPRQPGANPPTRFVRLEDPVPLGQANLGPGARVVRSGRVSVLDPIKNHDLANYIPWMKAPIPDDPSKPSMLDRAHKKLEAAWARAADLHAQVSRRFSSMW